MYKIIIKKSALKDLEGIPKMYRIPIIERIDALAGNARPDGVKKLENSPNTYRIRVADYRIVYEVTDRELIIEVIKVAHRGHVYKKK